MPQMAKPSGPRIVLSSSSIYRLCSKSEFDRSITAGSKRSRTQDLVKRARVRHPMIPRNQQGCTQIHPSRCLNDAIGIYESATLPGSPQASLMWRKKCLDALGTTVLINHGGSQALGECENSRHRPLGIPPETSGRPCALSVVPRYKHCWPFPSRKPSLRCRNSQAKTFNTARRFY